MGGAAHHRNVRVRIRASSRRFTPLRRKEIFGYKFSRTGDRFASPQIRILSQNIPISRRAPVAKDGHSERSKEEMMIVINMPGGGVQDIDEAELLWFRKAFDGEWKGATMLQLAADRIYSNESMDDLSEKFEQAKLPLVEFLAPESTKTKLLVSSQRVRQVGPYYL
jgi:hypothetical protein